MLENRAYLDKQDREHQREVDRLQSQHERQLRLHSDLIGKIIKATEVDEIVSLLSSTKHSKSSGGKS